MDINPPLRCGVMYTPNIRLPFHLPPKYNTYSDEFTQSENEIMLILGRILKRTIRFVPFGNGSYDNGVLDLYNNLTDLTNADFSPLQQRLRLVDYIPQWLGEEAVTTVFSKKVLSLSAEFNWYTLFTPTSWCVFTILTVLTRVIELSKRRNTVALSVVFVLCEILLGVYYFLANFGILMHRIHAPEFPFDDIESFVSVVRDEGYQPLLFSGVSFNIELITLLGEDVPLVYMNTPIPRVEDLAHMLRLNPKLFIVRSERVSNVLINKDSLFVRPHFRFALGLPLLTSLIQYGSPYKHNVTKAFIWMQESGLIRGARMWGKPFFRFHNHHSREDHIPIGLRESRSFFYCLLMAYSVMSMGLGVYGGRRCANSRLFSDIYGN